MNKLQAALFTEDEIYSVETWYDDNRHIPITREEYHRLIIQVRQSHVILELANKKLNSRDMTNRLMNGWHSVSSSGIRI